MKILLRGVDTSELPGTTYPLSPPPALIPPRPPTLPTHPTPHTPIPFWTVCRDLNMPHIGASWNQIPPTPLIVSNTVTCKQCHYHVTDCACNVYSDVRVMLCGFFVVFFFVFWGGGWWCWWCGVVVVVSSSSFFSLSFFLFGECSQGVAAECGMHYKL